MIKHPSFINHLFTNENTLHNYFSRFPLLAQVFRFLVVGTTAAAVHFCLVVTLVQLKHLAPLIANFFAFLISFQVSYWGNRLWTFDGTTALHRVTFPKLLCVQIISFILGESLFYYLLLLPIPYQLALLIVLATMPFFTFTCNKLWVFK
ncbi:MAG: hypothetical protein ACD_46C00718G0007 [uncultured bacterium]|nr:MAG: hypothetical protein ACD_46C00718G0007 [uncultured bacterium]